MRRAGPRRMLKRRRAESRLSDRLETPADRSRRFVRADAAQNLDLRLHDLVGALIVLRRVERRAGGRHAERRAAIEAEDVAHLPARDDLREHCRHRPASGGPGPNGSSTMLVMFRLWVTVEVAERRDSDR